MRSERKRRDERRKEHEPMRLARSAVTIALVGLIGLVAPALLVAAALSARRPDAYSEAIRVRLGASHRAQLDHIEEWSKMHGQGDLTLSSMIRDAVAAYITPLVETLDRRSGLDDERQTQISTSPPVMREAFGEVTRVRLGAELVHQLDRIEAYARGLGFRHVTRSSLIRKSVGEYLTGFAAAVESSKQGTADSPSAAGSSLRT